jgi:hypothetical protein
MGVIITPVYSDLFDDKPVFSELIAGIPTKIILFICAVINAELYNNQFNWSKQKEILGFITRRFSQTQKNEIYGKLSNFINGKESETIVLFAKRYTVELIHRALMHLNKNEIEDTTPDQEFRLLQAYLLIADEINQKVEDSVSGFEKEADSQLGFRKFVWPVYLIQNEVNNSVSPHFQLLKITTFVKYLSEHDLFRTYIKKYLQSLGESHPIVYIFKLVSILHSSFKVGEGDKFIKKFTFIKSEINNTLLKSLSIDIEGYASNPDLQINYKGLKEKPLFEYEHNAYAPLNHDFLYSRIFNGFVFDFYYHSGISNEKGYTNFPSFKERYAKDYSESQLFRTLINIIFNWKHIIIDFSEDDGAPDCYVRVGKDIFLFEFKDYLVSDKVVICGQYELILDHLNEKFIENKKGKPKGVRQLRNQIISLSKKCFKFDDFELKGIKKKSITVYPIIIHTNHIYTIPEIGDYLNTEFRKRLDPTDFDIKDVVLIELETVFRFLKQFRSNRNAFKDSLEKFFNLKSNRLRKYRKESGIDNYIKAFTSFEDAIPILKFQESELRNKDFIREYLMLLVLEVFVRL